MMRFSSLLLLLLLGILLSFPLAGRAQDESVLDARQRVLSEVGPGLCAVHRGPAGQYYVLVAPGDAVLVFDATGKKLGQVPAHPLGAAAIVFGAAMDVDGSGRIYVADRGGNAVNVYASDGSLLARVTVPAPVGIAALPEDEFAVSSLASDRLISAYDFQGKLLREFGDLADLAEQPSVNRRLNLGKLAADAAGNLYFAFQYLPEPTVRKYDRFGYLADEISLTTPESVPAAQAARREIARAATGATISPHEIISALGVDPATQELWIATGDLLLHFDGSGHQVGSGRTYTPKGARLQPTFILVEPDRLLLGNDPLGIYMFAKPAPATQPQ